MMIDYFRREILNSELNILSVFFSPIFEIQAEKSMCQSVT